MFSLKNKWPVFLLLAPLLSLAMATFHVYYHAKLNTYSGEARSFVINEGEPFSRINFRLHQEGFIFSKKLFYRICQWKGVMAQFRPGTYTIKPGMNMLTIIDLLLAGKVDLIKVTIPEGKNLYEIAQIYEQNGVLIKAAFIAEAVSAKYQSPFGPLTNGVEGFLYPETYYFSKGTRASTVIQKMLDVFTQKTVDLDFLQQSDLTPYQIITLASIVEKETGAAFERPRIAGVFFNRLQKKMRLQSDPTTIYGLYPKFNGNLQKHHLSQITPYNTYQIPALPKGPICNPGRAAIEGTLVPEQHQYLYFVSFNDGTHAFAASYKEHLKNVETYQKDSRARKGKSWRNLKQ